MKTLNKDLKYVLAFRFNVSIVISGLNCKLHPGERTSRYSTNVSSSPIRINVKTPGLEMIYETQKTTEKQNEVLLEKLKIRVSFQLRRATSLTVPAMFSYTE